MLQSREFRKPSPMNTTRPVQATGRTEFSPPAPTEDEIRQRAFELYEARGREPGHDVEDWQQAERELRQAKRTLQ